MNTRRAFLRSGVSLAGGLLAGLACPALLRLSRQPNILLVCIDTLRADRTGYCGGRRRLTPFIDGLAESGVGYVNAAASAPWTKPAVASAFTGLHPLGHGAIGTMSALSPSIPTVTSTLAQAGYRTFCVQTNPFLGTEAHGFRRGFDSFHYLAPEGATAAPDGAVDAFADAAAVQRQVRALIPSLTESKPFFLYLHFMDPHEPRRPPQPYRRRFGIADNAQQRARDIYDGAVRYADDVLAGIVRELHRARLMDNTVTLLFSDHGEEFWEHGETGHGQSLYSELLDIALVVSGAGVPNDGPSARSVSQVDIAPTLLAVAGLQPGHQMDGMNLLDTEAAQAPCQYAHAGIIARNPVERHAIVEAGAKLIRSAADQYELYDLRRDPREQHNLSTDRQAVTDDMVERLTAFLASTRHAVDTPVDATADPAFLRQVKALGYLN